MGDVEEHVELGHVVLEPHEKGVVEADHVYTI